MSHFSDYLIIDSFAFLSNSQIIFIQFDFLFIANLLFTSECCCFFA